MTPKRLCFKISAILLAACIWFPGCSKKGDTTETASTSPELAELTKQVRRYSIEKRKLPQSVEDLVTAGYIQAVPPAPTGKKYAIDTDRAQVIVVDQ
jgi:competence protein ComGC